MARLTLFGTFAIALVMAVPLSAHALPASTIAQRSPAEIEAQRRWEADQERARQMELDRQERERQREAERLRQEEREAERLEWQRQNDDWRENREDQWDDWEDDWRDRHRDGQDRDRYDDRDRDRFDCGDRWSNRDCDDDRYYWYDQYDQYDPRDRYDYNDSYLYYDSPDYRDGWQQVNEAIPVTFAALGRDWTMVSIQGRTIHQELSFTSGSQQTLSLIPGTYYLRFRDTYSSSYWEMGYLVVEEGDRAVVQFDSDRNWVSVEDGDWQSERSRSSDTFDWPTYP